MTLGSCRPARLVALMSLSLLWAHDSAAVDEPARVLRAPVRRSARRRRALAVSSLAHAGARRSRRSPSGCLFAAVGIGEAWTHRLLFYEPKLAVANSYTSYFRVTSFFADPSIYARHLVIALTILVVAVLLARINVVLGAALHGVHLGRPLLLVLAVEHGRARRLDRSSSRPSPAGGAPGG